VSAGEDPQALAEARHRMANVFQLLTTLARLRAQRGEGGEARREVEWLHDAITAQGALQRRQFTAEGCEFAAFLGDMQPNWSRRIGARPIVLTLEAEPLPLVDQTATALATIVQELVANAIAHAFPGARAGTIWVSLARLEGERAALVVADDGVGYTPGAPDPARLGLWLVGGLASQVKGALTTTIDAGVTVRLEFPAA
jgi:two-component sensor histidine kinase